MPRSTRRTTPSAITSWKASSRSRRRSTRADIRSLHRRCRAIRVCDIVRSAPAPHVLAGKEKLTGASQRGLHASAMLLPHSDCLGERGTGMPFHRPWLCLGPRLAAIAVTALLCACAGERDLPGDPSFYQSLATNDAHGDATIGASMICASPTNSGLTGVPLDPDYRRRAEAQAKAMASRDTLSHDIARSFHD